MSGPYIFDGTEIDTLRTALDVLSSSPWKAEVERTPRASASAQIVQEALITKRKLPPKGAIGQFPLLSEEVDTILKALDLLKENYDQKASRVDPTLKKPVLEALTLLQGKKDNRARRNEETFSFRDFWTSSGMKLIMLASINFAITTISPITLFILVLSIRYDDPFGIEVLCTVLSLCYWWFLHGLISSVKTSQVFSVVSITLRFLYLAVLSRTVGTTVFLLGSLIYILYSSRSYTCDHFFFIVLLFQAQTSLSLVSLPLRGVCLIIISIGMIFLFGVLLIARRSHPFLRKYHLLLLLCTLCFGAFPNYPNFSQPAEESLKIQESVKILDKHANAASSTCFGGTFETGPSTEIFQPNRTVSAIVCFYESSVRLSAKLQIDQGDYDFVVLNRDTLNWTKIPQPVLIHQLEQVWSLLWGHRPSHWTVAAINTVIWDLRDGIRKFNTYSPFTETFYSIASYSFGQKSYQFIFEPCSKVLYATGGTLDQQLRTSIAQGDGCYNIWSITEEDKKLVGTLHLPCQTVLPKQVRQTIEFDRLNPNWLMPNKKRANFTIQKCVKLSCELYDDKVIRSQYQNYEEDDESHINLPRYDPNYVPPAEDFMDRQILPFLRKFIAALPNWNFLWNVGLARLKGSQDYIDLQIRRYLGWPLPPNPDPSVTLFHDYAKQYYSEWIELPQHWYKDEVFADQFLNGINPTMLVNATEVSLPQELTLDGQRVEDVTNITLEELKITRKLFFVDYKILQGLPPHDGKKKYYAPIVLFYLSNEFKLLPLCIQLDRKGTKVFWPSQSSKQSKKEWLLAKMYVLNADAQYHEMVTHLLLTHLVLEPICVAHRRRFTRHPLLGKLMSLHLEGTESINSLGRETLLHREGDFERLSSIGLKAALKLMEKVYGDPLDPFKVPESLNFPLSMKKRGFFRASESDRFAEYYYRDYGFRLWDALSRLIDNLVNATYKTEDDLENDKILQSFFCELQYAKIPGIDHNQKWTRKTWSDFLTSIIFTGSVQHAAVNDGQLYFYGWIPNRPFLMKQEMPENEDLEAWLLNALADSKQAGDSVNLARSLSARVQSKTLLTSGNLDREVMSLPDSDPFKIHYRAFKQELREIETYIQDQQKNSNAMHGKYMYLCPSEIPVSTAV